MENSHSFAYTDEESMVLISSICGPLFSKVKLILKNPQKNIKIAQNDHILAIIELLAEQLVPQYCAQNQKRGERLSVMHSLVYLLAQKTQQVFTSSVVRTCIDQNWDMKGFKSVLLRILKELGLSQDQDTVKLKEYFDKLIQSQNLQSQSCIKAISHFLKNPKKHMDEDDLKNPIVSFQTSFEFVRADVERFRSQNMKYECFQVLHPWAYDLEQVDFKYVINKDQTAAICKNLKSLEARIFWLSNFKSQLAVSADEFIAALREFCVMNLIQEHFEAHYESEYKLLMVQTDYSIILSMHGKQIEKIIQAANSEALRRYNGHSILKGDQVKFPGQSARQRINSKNEYISEEKLSKLFQIGDAPVFDVMTICQIRSWLIIDSQAKVKLDLRRSTFVMLPNARQDSKISLRFASVDTDELRDLEIKFNGEAAQFKVGEGDCNHYVIANDKKLWESQFVIINKDGQYYLRDLGIVHTSRLKVTGKTALQLHQGALIDLGKVVHYHVNKLTHETAPRVSSSSEFIVMKGSLPDYKVDEEAMLRARPAWVSADENRDMVQNEIMLESSNKQNKFSIGRSNRRDVELKLKAVSADHCKIEYSKDKGWLIHEQGKDRLSSNGTFVFMKSHQQMEDHEPSDMIPLFNGMIISFINYELQVRIEPKSQEEIANSHFEAYQGVAPSAHGSVNPTPRDDLKSSVAPSYKPDVSPTPSKPVSVYKESIHSERQFEATANAKDHSEYGHSIGKPPVQIVDEIKPEDSPTSKVSQTEKVRLSELKAADNHSPHHSEKAASVHGDSPKEVEEAVIQTSHREESKAPSAKQSVRGDVSKPESVRHSEIKPPSEHPGEIIESNRQSAAHEESKRQSMVSKHDQSIHEQQLHQEDQVHQDAPKTETPKETPKPTPQPSARKEDASHRSAIEENKETSDKRASIVSQKPVDSNHNGIPDYQEIDKDQNGIPDYIEGNKTPNKTASIVSQKPLDSNHNGIPDYQEVDKDHNGIPDYIEGNKTPNQTASIVSQKPTDSNNNGIPDYQEVDKDHNGIPDYIEGNKTPNKTASIVSQKPVDSNNNGIPDYQEVDKDHNGIPDYIEGNKTPSKAASIVSQKPADSNHNGIPDYQEVDKDHNGIPDYIEEKKNPEKTASIVSQKPVDSNHNGIPDNQEVDKDHNGIPDYIEQKRESIVEEKQLTPKKESVISEMKHEEPHLETPHQSQKPEEQPVSQRNDAIKTPAGSIPPSARDKDHSVHEEAKLESPPKTPKDVPTPHESHKVSVVESHKDDHNASVIVEEHKASIIDSHKEEHKASVVDSHKDDKKASVVESHKASVSDPHPVEEHKQSVVDSHKASVVDPPADQSHKASVVEDHKASIVQSTHKESVHESAHVETPGKGGALENSEFEMVNKSEAPDN